MSDYVIAELTDPTYLKVCNGEPISAEELAVWKARSDARLDASIVENYTRQTGLTQLPEQWRTPTTPAQEGTAPASSSHSLEP